MWSNERGQDPARGKLVADVRINKFVVIATSGLRSIMFEA